MSTAVVSGPLANKPRTGGEAWVPLSWVLGLRRLGFDAWLVEQIAPEQRTDDAVAWFDEVAERFSVPAALVSGGDVLRGPTLGELRDVLAESALLLNISGHLPAGDLRDAARLRVYLDLDPGFTQLWQVQGIAGARLEGHDAYYTIAGNLGEPGCEIPSVGIDWRRVEPPVVLDEWPVAANGGGARFTTVARWRGPFGPVEHGGRTYGLKVHEFRRVAELPRLAAGEWEIALDIDPADAADRDMLAAAGWRLVDPRAVAADPDSFRAYVQGSSAEFSVAQGMYVDTGSGWFSDRSTRYLASGKPVLVQDTGFGSRLPAGEGVVPFATLEDAVAGAEAIAADYAAHSAAARRIAEEHFDSDLVIGRMLDELGVAA